MKITSSYFKRDYDLSKSELVGQGNFAQVYRIYDSQLKDFLAIRKVVKSQADQEDLAKEKVINEELMKVQNQNILQIFDIIDGEEYIWYITEYCQGGSLWDALNQLKDNRMKEKDAMQCVLQISKGVQQLHNHRITHRDLKPQNILLKTKYVFGKPLPLVKLADFGLSTKKIIMETIAGTKQYIAPEQAKFQNYTNAVDVWSLGIICDEILHGNPFYSGENNKEVFNKILKLPYQVRDQAIRQSIQDLLISLLKKKPYERPIIAVIRKNIQKILEEIEQQKTGINSNNVAKQVFKKKKEQNIPSIDKISQGKNNQSSNNMIKSESQIQLKNQSQLKKIYSQNQQNEQRINQKIKNNFLDNALKDFKPKEYKLHKEKQKNNQILINPNVSTSKSTDKIPFPMNKLFEPISAKKINPNNSNQYQKLDSILPLDKQSKKQNNAIKQHQINRFIRPKQEKEQIAEGIKKSTENIQKINDERDKIKQQSLNISEKILLKHEQIIPNQQFVRTNKSNSVNTSKNNVPTKQNLGNTLTAKRKISPNNFKSINATNCDIVITKDQIQQPHKNVIAYQKVQIHKFDKKKKTVPSNNQNFNKNETKFDIVDIDQYIEKVFLLKDQISNKKLLTAHDRSFIPNAYLTNIDSPSQISAPEQSFNSFKKKMNFLNYFESSKQYQLKIYKGESSLIKDKQQCTNQFSEYKKSIKNTFFKQIDLFIDNYIEKVIK